MNRKIVDACGRCQNPTTIDIHDASLQPDAHRCCQATPNPESLLATRFRNAGQRRYSRGRKGDRWMQKYLFLFCKTWSTLFLATVVCSSLAQSHIMDDDETDPFMKYSFNRDQAMERRHHLNNDSRPFHAPENLFHRPNISRPYLARHHRSRQESYRLAEHKSGDQFHQGQNRAATSKSSALAFEKRQEERPGTQSRYYPIPNNFSDRSPRALTRLHQQKSRTFSDYGAQSDGVHTYDDADVDDNGRPCVYSGHLKTERNWYGYLANISLAGGSGRLVFEFSYPAESCCVSVLFYYEDQLSIMSARTNCWQKEDLLRPDVDQILRLTPSFSWSGCQVKKRLGSDMMVCKGGRSFTKHGYDFRSTLSREKPVADDKAGQKHRNADVASNAAVWYVAVSHCASLRGLNLRYKLKVYGHSVPCQADYGSEDDSSSDRENPLPAKNHNKQTTMNKHANESQKKDADVRQENSFGLPSSSSSSHSSSSSYQSHRPSDAAHTHLASDEWPVCTIEGSVNTTHSWFGFIRNLSLIDGGGFRFYFSLPYSMSPMNVLLYHDEDIRKLHWEQICWLKESVIESKHVLERIIDLTSRSIYNGCASKTGANIEGNNLTCRGEKIFSGDRNIYIALSNCRSRDGLLLKYKLEVFGYKDHTMCSSGVGIHQDAIVEKSFFTLSVYCSLFLSAVLSIHWRT